MTNLVSGHQPSYLPWLGYINKIVASDVFVLMDDVQFTRKDFIHKNVILSKDGPIQLSIPLDKGQDYINISNVRISTTKVFLSKNDWQYKHLNAIRHSYRRSPYFTQCFELIEKIYTTKQFEYLIDVTDTFLELILNLLQMPSSRIVRMSKDLKPTIATKDKLVLDHCVELGATHVLFGEQGREYVDLDNFKSCGIKVSFQNFAHPIYPQCQYSSSDFAEKICFIDALMNVGIDGFVDLVKNNT